MRLGHRHADGVTDPLTERARRGLDSRRVAKLRMTGRMTLPLPELLEIVERELVSGQIEAGVEEHRRVPAGEHEAVAIGPMRICRIVLHMLGEERIAEWG